jgi:hypothetical protein
MEQSKSTAQRVAQAIAKGIKDGLPVISNIRAALRDPAVPAFPRLLASLGTMVALVIAVWKFAQGSLSLDELIGLLSKLLPVGI